MTANHAISSPSVSVVLPCRNERNYIEHCVRSILNQDPPPGGFEIIVADGMSDDGTREILDRLKSGNACLRVIENPKRIVSTGLNAGIQAARGQIIIRMDAHTEYAKDYIQQCGQVLAETNADNVGGPWVAKGMGLMSTAIAVAFQSAFAVGGAKGHNPKYEGVVDTVYLGCWRREIFDRIGLFDESLVRNQDDEFNLRLTRAGGKIWQSPRIKSSYSPRGSLRALCRQYVQYGYWKVRVIQKHRTPASIRHLIPACFVFLLSVLPVVAIWWPLAGWGWVSLLGAYSTCNLAAAIMAGARRNIYLIPLLCVVFACYHVAYGYGFLRGIFDFLILRSEPKQAYSSLTRASSGQQ
jgi:succinoglycan biosynthesis protein ExoA